MLSAIGLMAGGDLISGKYSIGGADSRVPNTLGPSLGLDKHGVFEIDGSITREDIYFGNPADFRASRWERLVNISNSYGGQFGEETFIEEKGVAYDESRATNPDAFFGAKWFIVAHAERAFVYRGLPNGTDIGNADYANIAPFFLNETFPENWYRRGEAYDIVNVVTDILDLYLGSPRELGANEGLDDFVPLGIDISSLTVDQVACFVVENVLDIVPGSVQPALVENLDTFAAFVNAVIVPFFADYNCPLESFVGPAANATGDEIGSLANDGPVIVDGVYES